MNGTSAGPRAFLSFDGTETGNDFADYLVGAPSGFTQCSQQFLDSRSHYGAAFMQDSFRIKPNFTLNYGLRWEYSQPWWDTQGKIETIVPGLQSTQFPTAPLGWVVPGDPGDPEDPGTDRLQQFRAANWSGLFARIQRWSARQALWRPRQNQYSRLFRDLLHGHRRSESLLRSG